MTKTYQPQVLDLCERMMKVLIEEKFFEEYHVKNPEPAKTPLCDFLTEKFINGEIDPDEGVKATEEEMTVVFGQMISACTLDSLKEKGLLDSIEDENDEEMFFLTHKGRFFGSKLPEEN